MPRKMVLGALAVIAAFAVLLAAAVALVFATLRIERIASPAPHAASVGAELVFGAAALLAAVYIATRIAVRVFATSSASDAAHAAPSNYPASPSQLPRT